MSDKRLFRAWAVLVAISTVTLMAASHFLGLADEMLTGIGPLILILLGAVIGIADLAVAMWWDDRSLRAAHKKYLRGRT